MMPKQHVSREASLIDITDRNQLEEWLGKWPPEVSAVIAARAALRVLPFVWTAQESDFKGDLAADVVLPVLRATMFAWVGTRYSARVRFGHYAAANAAYSAAATAQSEAAYAAAYAAAAAGAAMTDDSSVKVEAINATARANAAYDVTAARAAATADIEAIERGTAVATLVARKLWPKRPYDLARNWSALKRYLLSREGENWNVWTDWYDARIAGRRAYEELEVARTTVDDDVWDQDPSVVNAEIRRLLDALTPLDTRVAAEALKQRPASFTFGISNSKIDAAPEDAVPLDKDIADDLYGEAKRKAQALDDRLKKIQADPHLRNNVKRFVGTLGTYASALRPGLLLSAVRGLEADVRAYDTEEGQKELAAGDLSRLLDLTATARDLIASFPKVREIEAEAVALDLPKDRLDEVREHVEEISGAVASSDGATESAKSAIAETVAGVPEARNDRDREKQLAYSLLDIANLTRTGLGYVKATGQKLARPVRGMARVVGGEVGDLARDSWRGVRRGFPKGVEAGAKIAGRSAAVGGIAGLMTLIAGPFAGLATLVSSFAPLGKVADQLSEPADDAGDHPSDDAQPDEEAAPDIRPAVKPAAKRRRAKA